MARWIDLQQAADQLGMDAKVLRKLVRFSNNPPPYVRPSERLMFFDAEALMEWQRSWKTHTGERYAG